MTDGNTHFHTNVFINSPTGNSIGMDPDDGIRHNGELIGEGGSTASFVLIETTTKKVELGPNKDLTFVKKPGNTPSAIYGMNGVTLSSTGKISMGGSSLDIRDLERLKVDIPAKIDGLKSRVNDTDGGVSASREKIISLEEKVKYLEAHLGDELFYYIGPNRIVMGGDSSVTMVEDERVVVYGNGTIDKVALSMKKDALSFTDHNPKGETTFRLEKDKLSFSGSDTVTSFEKKGISIERMGLRAITDLPTGVKTVYGMDHVILSGVTIDHALVNASKFTRILHVPVTAVLAVHLTTERKDLLFVEHIGRDSFILDFYRSPVTIPAGGRIIAGVRTMKNKISDFRLGQQTTSGYGGDIFSILLHKRWT